MDSDSPNKGDQSSLSLRRNLGRSLVCSIGLNFLITSPSPLIAAINVHLFIPAQNLPLATSGKPISGVTFLLCVKARIDLGVKQSTPSDSETHIIIDRIIGKRIARRYNVFSKSH